MTMSKRQIPLTDQNAIWRGSFGSHLNSNFMQINMRGVTAQQDKNTMLITSIRWLVDMSAQIAQRQKAYILKIFQNQHKHLICSNFQVNFSVPVQKVSSRCR